MIVNEKTIYVKHSLELGRENLLLFTDGSVNVKTKIGYGAYLLLKVEELSENALKSKVNIERFENTSSTKLELQTLLFALTKIDNSATKIIVYTDSQNIIRLPERRERLEKNDFRNSNNKLLKNHELYRDFFKIIDQLDIEFIKVKGHQPSSQKDTINQIFTLVDRAARKALREE